MACKATRDLALPHLYRVNPLQTLHYRPLCLSVSQIFVQDTPTPDHAPACAFQALTAALLSSWGVSWKIEMSQVPFAPMVLGP